MKKTVFSIIAVVMMAFTSAAQHSGQCGDNLTWNFDEGSGTLTISGTGDMWDRGEYEMWWINYVIDVVIQEGVTSVSPYAFALSPTLSSVSFPNTLMLIGDYAFYLCTSLTTSVTIPDFVTTIGSHAFDATGIESLTVGSSVSHIGESAFLYNYDLKSVVFRNSPAAIPDFAFFECKSLKTVDLGDSIVSIGYKAFNNCTALENINLSGTLRSIGFHAFSMCFSLQSVSFPDSLETIEECAFGGCGITGRLVLPNSLTHIEMLAFAGCGQITSVTIPASLSDIGKQAFTECTGIREVYCIPTTPPNLESEKTFAPEVYELATLYVPVGCKPLYEDAYVWKNFKSIVETADFTEENAASALRVYPNPAANSLKIEISDSVEPESVSFYDISGRLVKAQQSGFGSIDISGLATGMYIMKVALDDGKVFEEKIVKK